MPTNSAACSSAFVRRRDNATWIGRSTGAEGLSKARISMRVSGAEEIEHSIESVLRQPDVAATCVRGVLLSNDDARSLKPSDDPQAGAQRTPRAYAGARHGNTASFGMSDEQVEQHVPGRGTKEPGARGKAAVAVVPLLIETPRTRDRRRVAVAGLPLGIGHGGPPEQGFRDRDLLDLSRPTASASRGMVA